EHKAYLHRSGRTARAGQPGTVVTLVLAEQYTEVNQLMKAAKITPRMHPEGASEGLLDQLVPGPRTYLDQAELEKLLAHAIPAAQNGQAKRKPSASRGGNRSGRAGRHTGSKR